MTRKKKVGNIGLVKAVVSERLRHLRDEAAWYLHRSIETRHVVSFCYMYRYKMVMKKAIVLERALEYLQ